MIITIMPAYTHVASGATKRKVTVSTQSGIKKAVKSKKLKTLTIMTGKNKTFTIPKGDYSKVTIVVNSSKGTVKISKKSKVKELRIVKKNSDIRVNIAGELPKISIEKKTSLKISGTTKKRINVNIGDKAGNTKVISSVKLLVKTMPSATINFKKGAEESLVIYNDEQKEIKVINNTKGNVTVQDSKGEQIIVSKTKTFISLDFEKEQEEKQDSDSGRHVSDKPKDSQLGENETEWDYN